MAKTGSLDNLVNDIDGKSAELPPVEKWNPDYSGEIDIVIDRDGNWFHEGDAFQRESLVKLFSSILKKEGDDYFLVSPVEKFKLQVSDLPFVVVDLNVEEVAGKQRLSFVTNIGETVVANGDHPIEVEYKDGDDQPYPKIKVRRNLYARIHRNVFYELVELAEEVEQDGQFCMVVKSEGEEFELGRY